MTRFPLAKLVAAAALFVPLFALSQTTVTIKGSNTNPGDVVQIQADAQVGIVVDADGIEVTVPGIDIRTKCLGDLSNPTYCIVAAGGTPPQAGDVDNDGVPDGVDQCEPTDPGVMTDRFGCSLAQQDPDGDGVPGDEASNGRDDCPNTASGATVNADGCSESQLGAGDADGDGVPNSGDSCANTPSNETANNDGCSPSQLDTDNDGVTDNLDQCANTPTNETADSSGCSPSQVGNTASYCVNTPSDFDCSPSTDLDPFWADVGEASPEGFLNQPIARGRGLAIPFTLSASSTRVGRLQFSNSDSFDPGFNFRFWYSATPGGTPLSGSGCDSTFDARADRLWSQDSSRTGGITNPACNLGTQERVLYANFEVICTQSSSCTLGSRMNRTYFFDIARYDSW